MIRVLSREPDRSMLGFSMEVAKLVTQPFCRTNARQPSVRLDSTVQDVALQLVAGTSGYGGRGLTWPSRVPLRISCSAMLKYPFQV